MISKTLTIALVLVPALAIAQAHPGSHPAGSGRVYPLPHDITGLEEVATAELPGGGKGIIIDDERRLLYWTGDDERGASGLVPQQSLRVFDIQDPAVPRLFGQMDGICAQDVDVVQWADRNLIVTSEECYDDAGFGIESGIRIVDVSDPTAPTTVAFATEFGAHTLAAVPGTPYVYGAHPRASELSFPTQLVGFAERPEGRIVPVLDLTEPAAPVWHTFEIPPTVNGVPIQSDGCHEVSVRVDLGRAYCAGGGSFYHTGGGESFVWDISDDPLNPRWIGVVDDPRINFHHSAVASDDGNNLFVGDEDLNPTCLVVDTPPGRIEQFTGRLWAFDISEPSRPRLESSVQVEVPWSSDAPLDFDFNCGAHDGDRIDGRGFLAWGWYMGGTVLIDARDPSALRIVDRQVDESPASALVNWEVMYSNGHVFSSDNGYWDETTHHLLAVYRIV